MTNQSCSIYVSVSSIHISKCLVHFYSLYKKYCVFVFQAKMVNADYPWYAAVLAFVLVFSSIGCIPVIAILRKFKILNWNYAKQIQAETHGHTQSTAKFIRSVSSMDNDSGHNSDELPTEMMPYTDEPRKEEVIGDGAVKFHLMNK